MSDARPAAGPCGVGGRPAVPDGCGFAGDRPDSSPGADAWGIDALPEVGAGPAGEGPPDGAGGMLARPGAGTDGGETRPGIGTDGREA
ncbi:hypothetical protein Aca07nite_49740 [Actinoplanes capillaceus]|uniref:Uncharacterized protein n=1 Tax=Actinoplanes campanulatus TaxID=113559 RepID=A0ABQ3WNA2_9ACTN|nr:hypothetical protein Aca07nite_49740 [Actinoplanes capillaceus]